MRLTLLKSIQLVLLLLIIHVCQAQTGSGFKLKRVLSGATGQLVEDANMTVNDSLYFNFAQIPGLDTSYQVRNIITFSINEYSPLYLPASFNASAHVRIYYTLANLSIDSVDQTLTINYDTASSYTARSSFVFNNAHKVKIKLLNISVSADVLSVLQLENEMEVHPIYKLSRTDNAVQNVFAVSTANTDSTDELPVNWTAITGADVYDLEWAYVDSSAVDSGRYGIPVNPKLIFENNTTRVTVSDNKYAIPLLYDNGGVLYFRVRAVQEKSDYSRFETAWSSDYSTGLGKFGFVGHQRKLNWQSSISFAEEGKRKVVVQYFDGSLRSRQTVTKDNTTNNTIVAETFYDYQGRPAVQVLPAPTLNTVLKYSRNINAAMNSAEYDKDRYDHIDQPSDLLTGSAAPMSSNSGANQYYSPNNPEKNTGINQYIPDAKGYAFTETEYEPDGTGRIRRQGGVGSTFQLGSNHEAKYFYSGATQNDLDALFGTEAGDASHYFKNMVRDANGQYAVSYLDMHGRTIATALAGSPENTSLADLPSKEVLTVTDSLSGVGSNVVSDLTMSNHHSLVITQDDTVTFHYRLAPPVLTKDGCDTSVNYKGIYDLEIKITDDSYNLHVGVNGQPFDTVLRVTDAIDVTFKKYLVKGTYEIHKTLQVNKARMDYYRDSIFLKNAVCTNEEQFISDQTIQQRKAACVPDCQSCRASVGTWDEFRVSFVVAAGNSIQDTALYSGDAWSAYNEALSACNDLCGTTTETEDILTKMLLDMSGPSGQYATVSDSIFSKSIFHRDDDNPLAPYQQDDIIYLDESGHPDLVYDENTNTYVRPQLLTSDQFADRFRSSWASALLPFHPEYCKYIQMQHYAASEAWDVQFSNTDTYAEAKAAGFLNPTGRADVSSIFGSINTDPLASEAATALNTKLTNYAGTYSMWSFAAISIKCGANDPGCPANYSTEAAAFNPQMCSGDLDMVWRTFRDLYQGVKRDIISAAVIKSCKNNGLSSDQILNAGKQVRFNNSADIISKGGMSGYVNGSLDTTAIRNSAKAIENDLYETNCRAYVAYWTRQLAPCKYTDTASLNDLMDDLVEICKAGSDLNHTKGSSTVKPGTTGTKYKSFDEALAAYNSLHHIDSPLVCNGELIAIPRPYDKQVAFSNIPAYTKPTDCQCDKLHDLEREYEAVKKTTDTDLATYLKRTRGTSLSQSDLNVLLDACNTPATGGCTYLPKMINIPPVMQCDVAPACVTCAEISTLYTKYQAAYPGNLPVVPTADSVQMQKNKLFAAYMNNHLGFSKDAWEYKEFIDSCSAISNPNGTVVCKPLHQTVVSRITNQYSNGGTTNVINDAVRTKTNGYLLSGYTSACSAGGTDGYMIKTDSAGGLIWSKTFGGEQDDQFVRVRATADSGFIAIGNTNSYCYDLGAILIVKVDAAGNVKWNRAIDMGEGFGAEGTDVIELSDGKIAFAGLRTTNTIGQQWITGVLSDSGQLSWMKQWSSAGQLGNTLRTNLYLVENNDTLVAAGGANTSSGSLQDILVFKTNKFSGELLNSKAYDAAGETTALLSIVKTTTGYKIATVNSNNEGYGGILDISHGGNIVRANKVVSPLGIGNFFWYTTPSSDGGLLMTQYTNRQPQDVYWYKLGADNSMQWSKRVRVDGGRRFFNRIIQNSDGTIAGAGVSDNATSMLMLGSSSGKGSCRDTVYDNPISGISTFTASIVTTGNISAEVKLGDNNLSSISLIETVCTNTRTIVSCPETDSCYTVGDGPLLCGNAEPVFTAVDVNDISNCSDSTFFAVSAGRVMYRAYLDSVRNNFNEDYIKTTLTAGDLEQFAVTYSTSEYHYTLYYYDQAGNLVKTVPPAGVVKNRSTAWLDQVKVARRDNLRLVPAHKMVTVYKYNTLNQVVAQKTPDAGQSQFWYDRLGRIVTSQNAKQVSDNNYSYTLFDDLGRITEVGELTSSNAMTDEISRKASALNSWINAVSSSKTQITQTVYDQPLTPFGGELWNPVNLRNRVSWSAVYNTYADVLGGNYVTGSFYTYDILGNVKTLLQDYKTIVTSKQADRWKRINYDYDLVSGKVNMVSYQSGNPDAFYHRYTYDAENRITGVATSHDSVYWENDAYYQYYKHGVLARSVIGQQQVQGVDYAYTLQGWLKGVNSTALTPTYDMGGDGSMVAKDAFGFALHYYGNEYSPVNSSKSPFANPVLSKPLFNGNIAAISQHLPALGAPLLSSYSYDVLNRLVGMQVSNGLNTSTNTWTPVALDDYKEKISYDANGNILTYSRNGNKAVPDKAMDRLAYTYKTGRNQLDFITDSVGVATYDNDIDNQLSANYAYDSIGNLVKDNAGGISEIKWTVYGKIASITKADGTIISYAYDVAGNRISKKVNDVQTWYVRDATGNVMSIYTKGDPAVNGGALTQTEIDLYGSSRLGINTLSTNVDAPNSAVTDLTGLGNGINISFIRGKKFFELSNHLGNVLATVSDKKLGVSVNGTAIGYYNADIVSAQEYYPFGMQMPGRGISSSKYRYGFNGKENDNEVKGEGNQQDYGMRVYDPRVGKFLSVDPISAQYPELTPYQFASNRPIDGIDLDGKEWSLSTTVEQIKAKMELKSYAEVTKIANQPRFVATGVSKIPTSVKVHNYYTQNSTTRDLANALTLGIDGMLYNLFNDSKIVGTSIINGPQHSTDLAGNKIDEKGRVMAFTNVTGTLLSLGEFASVPRPQGVNAKDFSAMSKYLKSTVGDISNDIVVQGSRASGTATATSDIDIAIKVGPEQFDELISKAFGTPNLGSAKWKTMQHAIKTGKITTGDAGLRSVKNGLLEILDMKVDLSVIKKGGPFDNGAQIPIRGASSNKTR